MIHFIPEPAEAVELSGVGRDAGHATPGPYSEAVARLASIRQALACVEQFAGEAVSDSLVEARLATAWPDASHAQQRLYQRQSARAASAAAAGLEMLSALRHSPVPPHPAAVQQLKRELAGGVDEIDRLFSL